MNRILSVALWLLLNSTYIYAQQDTLPKVVRDSITQLLLEADASDQLYRNALDGVREKYGAESYEMKELFNKMRQADSLNTIIVSGIIDTYGWLGAAEIGEQASVTLFFVIQHAELDCQDKYLPVFREAVKQGKGRAKDLALLEDRVALKQGRLQLYGTQLLWNMKTNSSVVAPLADPDNVDKRRAAIGLGLLSEYVSAFDIIWNVEKYKKDLPQISADFFKHNAH